MLRFAIKRLLGAIPTLLLIVTVSFFLMRIAPAAPSTRSARCPGRPLRQGTHRPAGDRGAAEARLSPGRASADAVRALSRRPAHGDFGPSLQYKDFTVTELIGGGFPVSLRLGGIAILLALIAGVAIGTLAALRQNSSTDYAAMGVAMTGIMIPNFVLAPLLTLVFGLWLALASRRRLGTAIVSHMILPVIALASIRSSCIARLTRGSMIEVLRTNYVRTARAKGLPERIAIIAPCAEGRPCCR